ncbi:MAG TPA: EAL domain-containing protein [Thermoanaerobaculia bacterium]|nr:EAL domain-containing protein [Thermoanaerobaculia bacterium]
MSAKIARAWFLEGFVDDVGNDWRTRVKPPFRIGRQDGCDLQLRTRGISGVHAEIVDGPAGLVIRDVDSKNGTFVNGERIEGERPLREGDVLEIGEHEFRLIELDYDNASFATTLTLDMEEIRRARQALGLRPEMTELIEQQQVATVFQPVVALESGRRVGFEMLSRGLRDDLPIEPAALLLLAETLGLEVDLSYMFRHRGALEAARLPAGSTLFLNLHPVELDHPESLLESARMILKMLPGRELVFEIHELALTDSEVLKQLQSDLRALGVALAFDDFGNGRSRLLELADLEPRLVKFDRKMIAGLDLATVARRDMVSRLVSMVRELGISTLAEGVETAGEAEICREVGFDYAQGYLFGRPAPVETYAA